ncbi:ESCRT-I complex subunit VPS37 [Mytilus galloprovincialis]|uniref:ESCRT-I complex subunit VPS37 n=1 Tax=Mytilus galloprovincialis TaxID=29158 RepID=A0A8B6BI96_MYTGA|nr:ESCRT-I complex subunit VPS37 [Mytilus galloprovincialis]
MYNNYSDTDMQIQAPKLTPNDQEVEGLIKNCSKEELQQLLEDEDKMIGLITDLNQVKRLQTDKEMTIVKNKSMAEYNLSIEPKLYDMRSKVATLYEEANKLKTELATDKSRLDAKRGEISLDVMSVMLQTEAAKSEEDSEKLADNFCEGKVSLDNFLETYISSRTMSHLRQIKSQKMNELVREHSPTRNRGQISSSYNNDIRSPGLAPYPAYSSSAGQYPASGYSMPQPYYAS